MVISTIATQYQYWAPNEINQMPMVADNEIGINTDTAAMQDSALNKARYCKCEQTRYIGLKSRITTLTTISIRGLD